MLITTDHLKNIHKLLTVSELIFDDYISIEKVLKTINRLLNRTTAESDKILNEVLKRITSVMSINLIQRIYTALIYSLLSAYYKKLITIILHKKSKKNYLLSESYRLITFKNILIKIIKKVLITYLSYTVKKYSLLL